MLWNIELDLHNDECEKEVEDFTSNDMVVDPGSPLRTGNFLNIFYPDSNHTEGVIQPPEWTALC